MADNANHVSTKLDSTGSRKGFPTNAEEAKACVEAKAARTAKQTAAHFPMSEEKKARVREYQICVSARSLLTMKPEKFRVGDSFVCTYGDAHRKVELMNQTREKGNKVCCLPKEHTLHMAVLGDRVIRNSEQILAAGPSALPQNGGYFDRRRFELISLEVPALIELCVQSSGIKQLGLTHNEIGDNGVAILSDALADGRLDNVQGLFLSNNNIGPRGCTALAKALHRHPAMTRLGMNCNPVGDAGVRAVADTIIANNASSESFMKVGVDAKADHNGLNCGVDRINNVQLRVVGFTACQVTNVGVAHMASALSQCHGTNGGGLYRLFFNQNPAVDDIGATDLAAMLTVNTTLLCSAGVRGFCIPSAPLTQTFCKRTTIGVEGAAELATALAGKEGFERLCFFGNVAEDGGPLAAIKCVNMKDHV